MAKRRIVLLTVIDVLLLLGLACWAPHLVEKPPSMLPPTLVIATATPFPGQIELLSVEIIDGPIEAPTPAVEGLTETLRSDWTPIATAAAHFAVARVRLVNYGKLPLDLGTVQAMLVDANGRRYRRDGQAELLSQSAWAMLSVPAGSTRELTWVFAVGDDPVPPYHIEMRWQGVQVRSGEVWP